MTVVVPAPVRVFVAERGNGFMYDIAMWLVDAARQSGRAAELVVDELPRLDGSINLVVAPHEFFELYPASDDELRRAAAVSICVGTEQPGTPWFRLTVDACRRGMIALDINPHGVAALRSAGIDAHHLQLGAVESMQAAAALGPTAQRPIDVLFLGGLDDRRGAALADLAPRLYERTSDLHLFRFDRPVSSATPGLVFGADKYELLASAKVIVNIHRDRGATTSTDAPAHYFEWARMVEAMANRCVVLTEPAETYEPLVAGEHFVASELDDLGATLDRLLDDDAWRERIADQAHAAVTGELHLGNGLSRALDRVEREVLPFLSAHLTQTDPNRGPWHLGATKVAAPVRLGPFTPYAEIRRRAKRLALDDTDMLRRLEATSALLQYGDSHHHTVTTTGAYRTTSPRVTAIVTLYNYEHVVLDALSSLAASTSVDMEIVVVDDHSSDGGRAIVERFLHDHDDLAMSLIAKDVNAGLADARNDAFAAARGEFVFVMDADNEVYPPCLARLAASLDSDPTASAAYAILEDFGEGRNLRSALDWDPQRLCAANYIDAQAMWRTADWERLGGFRNDDREVYGWEDWDLWLRLANEGGHALLRREILGRYRVQTSSMIALTNLETDDAIAAMRSRYPTLPWPSNGTA